MEKIANFKNNILYISNGEEYYHIDCKQFIKLSGKPPATTVYMINGSIVEYIKNYDEILDVMITKCKLSKAINLNYNLQRLAKMFIYESFKKQNIVLDEIGRAHV